MQVFFSSSTSILCSASGGLGTRKPANKAAGETLRSENDRSVGQGECVTDG